MVITVLVLALIVWFSPSARAVEAQRATFQCSYSAEYAQPPRGQPPDAVKLDGSSIVRARDGEPVQVKAVNWFGVHGNTTAPLESLWASGNAAVADMPVIAFQLRAQGFNGIRLPFTFSDLRSPPKAMWAKQGCRKVTLSVAQPQGPDDSTAAAPANAGPVRCSWYLPDSSSLDRYLWALQWFVANNYYVLLEHRPAPGDANAHSTEAFADGWRWLWRSVSCLPNFSSDLKGRVFVDLLGVPDATGHRWEPTIGRAGADLAGIAELYLGAMDALWSDTPGSLAFFITGGGQGGASTWGSGFATDKATIAVNDYSDPNPFFMALLRKPYRGAVILSPAVYTSDASAPPASMYQLPSWPVGPSPVKVMDTTFSYLAKEGYCLGNDCQVFPVAVGEFGSKLTSVSELSMLNEFAGHLAAAAVDYSGVGTWRYWGFDLAMPAAS